MSENFNNLKEIGNRITHNRDSIVELQDSVKQMSERKTEPSAYPAQRIQASGDELSIKDVMRNQARFSTAVQLGNAPTMLFSGELHKYVQFVTMFRNSFDKTINDPVALYEILMRHVKGPAKKVIESCIFSDLSVNR